VGNCTILKTLGRGSFGRVVLAQHSATGELAAVKLLPRGDYVSPGLAAYKHPAQLHLVVESGWDGTHAAGLSSALGSACSPASATTPAAACPPTRLPAGAAIPHLRGPREPAPRQPASPLCDRHQGGAADGALAGSRNGVRSGRGLVPPPAGARGRWWQRWQRRAAAGRGGGTLDVPAAHDWAGILPRAGAALVLHGKLQKLQTRRQLACGGSGYPRLCPGLACSYLLPMPLLMLPPPSLLHVACREWPIVISSWKTYC
jgi:hypothetical protein